jgi:hypothetical protein
LLGFADGEVSVHRYSSVLGQYVLLAGYPHSLTAELSPAALIPAFVSAAYTESSHVYFLSAGTVFEYLVTGTAFMDYIPGTVPAWQYEFVSTWEFSGAENPFGPPPGSALPPPPQCNLTALAGNAERLVAFCGADVYRFRRDTSTWALTGTIPASICGSSNGGGGGGGSGGGDD